MDPASVASGGVAGVGIDAVDVHRFRAVLERRPGLAARIFTDSERADAARHGVAAGGVETGPPLCAGLWKTRQRMRSPADFPRDGPG